MKKCKRPIRQSIKIAIITLAFLALAFPVRGAHAASIVSDMPDTGTWLGSSKFSDIDVILLPSRINLVEAKDQNNITFSDSNLQWFDKDDSNHIMSEVDSAYTIGYKASLKNGTVKPGSTVTIRYANAALSVDGKTKYDVELKVKVLGIKTSGSSPKGIPILYSDGDGRATGFSAFYYKQGDTDPGGRNGVKIRATVKLYASGTNTPIGSGHKMLWGFEDIDMTDYFTKKTWSSSNTWAESVNLVSGFHSPIHVAKNTILNHSTGSDSLRFYNKNEEGVKNNTASIILAVDPNGFTYEWSGSNCGTTFSAVSGTIFTAYSRIYPRAIADIDDTVENIRGKDYVVRDNSQTLTFRHKIERNSTGPLTVTQHYYIKAGGQSGNSKGSSSAPVTIEIGRGGKETIHDDEITVDFAPGESRVFWQQLYYQRSDLNTEIGSFLPITCKWDGVAGRACVRMHRPAAKFGGTVNGSIISGATANITSDGTEIDFDSGSYKITFNASIQRANAGTDSDQDDAGGTAKTNWWIEQTEQGATVAGSRRPTSGSSTTNDLRNGEVQNVLTDGDNYTFSGHLDYGERRTICAVMHYDNVIDAENSSTTARKCIKVWRDSKACSISSAGVFDLKNGENIGTVSAANDTLGTSVVTPSTPSLFTSSNSYTIERNLWARPGDSIRFRHDACAGGAYAVNNNSSLDNTKYKTVYVASGNLSDSNSEGYLFGDTIPTRKTSDPLRYNKTRSWDSSSASVGSFMSGEDEQVELGLTSPSIEDADSYTRDTYSCTNSNSTFEDYHYQIKGDTAAGGCNAKDMTDVSVDVGHTISQSLRWNHVKVVDGTIQSGYNRNYTAKANVKVPYNYFIQPAIKKSSSDNNNVVYLGATATFNVDLHVMPRVNTAVSTEEYATITKPTNVTVRYYFKGVRTISRPWGGSYEQDYTWGSSNVASSEDIRLNTRGNLDGTPVQSGSTTESVADGGYSYTRFDIQLGSSDVDVGDQVCAEVSVWPSDSHNSYPNTYPLNTSVNGAGTSNVALSEDGSSTKLTRTTCYTVAKRPTMSVEASNAYAGGDYGFQTSRYSKQFSGSNSSYTFGSWAEYGVYGKVAIGGGRGFASGATFGYATGNNGVGINATRDNNEKTAQNLDDATGEDICIFSTQTFANADCNSAMGSIGTVGMGKTSAKDFRDRIRSRFALADNKEASTPTKSAQYYCMDQTYKWDNTRCRNKKDNRYYTGAEAFGKIRIGSEDYLYLRNYINSKFDDNGINHTFVKDNAYIGAAESRLSLYAPHNFGNNQQYTDPDTGVTYSDRNYTRVMQVTNSSHSAKLIIDSDIFVGKYSETNSNENDSDPTLHNTGEVVQFIIIADKVEITSRVNRIDAIIIADEINTCAIDIPSVTVSTYGGQAYSDTITNLKNGTRTSMGEMSAESCDNQILFRAPVITNKLILNRTYGADSGTNSVKRAEIFSLNPYTYLWSYGQMSRYSQAVMTYHRELPSRY